MLNRKKTAAVLLAGIGLTFALTAGGCSAADTTSKDLSTAADNFEIQRRIVFFNGITDKYLLVIEGRCSVSPDSAGKKLDVTCKTGDNTYKKHMLGLSDNVSYFLEQTESAQADPFHYRVDFRPETIIPDINVKVSK